MVRVMGDLQSSDADIDIGSGPMNLSQESEATDVGKPFYGPGTLPVVDNARQALR